MNQDVLNQFVSPVSRIHTLIVCAAEDLWGARLAAALAAPNHQVRAFQVRAVECLREAEFYLASCAQLPDVIVTDPAHVPQLWAALKKLAAPLPTPMLVTGSDAALESDVCRRLLLAGVTANLVITARPADASAARTQLESFFSLKRQLNRVEAESSTDALTGLPNRRAYTQVIEQLVRQADTPPHQQIDFGHLDIFGSEQFVVRRRPEFALIVIDIDFFKNVNDTHGHDTGDEVLREVAAILRRRARAGDTVARLGGEEFVVLVAEAAVDEAREAAERFRRAVEATRFPLVERVTISLGVAAYPEHGASATGLFAAADAALYAAKRRGRNRVCVAAANEETLKHGA